MPFAIVENRAERKSCIKIEKEIIILRGEQAANSMGLEKTGLLAGAQQVWTAKDGKIKKQR